MGRRWTGLRLFILARSTISTSRDGGRGSLFGPFRADARDVEDDDEEEEEDDNDDDDESDEEDEARLRCVRALAMIVGSFICECLIPQMVFTFHQMLVDIGGAALTRGSTTLRHSLFLNLLSHGLVL